MLLLLEKKPRKLWCLCQKKNRGEETGTTILYSTKKPRKISPFACSLSSWESKPQTPLGIKLLLILLLEVGRHEMDIQCCGGRKDRKISDITISLSLWEKGDENPSRFFLPFCLKVFSLITQTPKVKKLRYTTKVRKSTIPEKKPEQSESFLVHIWCFEWL